MPLFEDPDEEIVEIQRTKAKKQTRPTADPRTVQLIERWTREAPWMKSSAVLPLARKGIGPNSPRGREIIRAGAKVKKKKSGLGFHTIGDIVSGGAGAFADVAEDVGGGVSTVAKGAARTGFAALQFGGEAIQGTAREFVNNGVEGSDLGQFGGVPLSARQAQSIAGQTTVGAAAEKWRETGRVSLGSGWFPMGEAQKRQSENARKAAPLIGGHGWSIGRAIANTVFEPGSKPFTVLSGLGDLAPAVVDPGAAAAKAVGRAGKARKLFDAGAVYGSRRTVLPEAVDAWLSSKDGRNVVKFLADTDDFDTIWKRTGQEIDVKTVVKLADATTEDDVLTILKPQLGVELLEKPTLGRLPTVQRRMDRVRLLQTMPGSHIDPNDLDDAVKQLDRFQKNVKLDPEVIARNNRLLAEATSPTEVYDVLINSVLKKAVSPKLGRFTKAWSNYHREFARYFVDEIGENVPVVGATIDDVAQALPTPHLYVEYLNGAIPLPDARELRRATSKLGRFIENHPTADVGVAAADAFMQEAWKPMTLLRGAWTVRVIGEEQVRMGAAGLNSIFAHPLSHIADIVKKRGASGITGEALRESDEGRAALSRGSGGFRGSRSLVKTRYKTVYARGDEQFADSWAEELAQLHADPVAKRLVSGLSEGDRMPGVRTGNPLEDVKAWFFEGAGRKFRKEMAEAGGRDDLLTREGADAYIDTVMRRVKIKTGEHSDLLDLVATGKLGDDALTDGQRINRTVSDRLAAMAEEGVGPQRVKGDVTIRVKGTAGGKVAERLDQATETLFNTLMSRPTNFLSRSPAFKQYYWQRVRTLLPSMDETAKAQALANAEKSGLAGNDLVALQKASKRIGAEGRALSLEEADHLAKGYGLDKTRDLLYDLSERSQFFDVTRLIMPFGEAWKEVLTRWAKLGIENPAIPRRAQQIVQGARGSGVFYENEYGEEVFAYPGTEFLTDKMIGAPIPFEGRVAGLSLMTEVLPGVGPVVQIPAGMYLPETPEWDGVREILLPFGERDSEAGFVESNLPAWLQKLRTSGLLRNVPGVSLVMNTDDTQERLLNNTAFDLFAWEVSSGKRKRPETLEDIQGGVEANMAKARWLYVIRGGAQFVAPTAPSPAHVAMDKNGNVQVASRMRDDLYVLQNGDPEKGIKGLGYEQGFQAWLDKYGDAAYLLSQPKSNSLVYGAPVTSDGVEWERANPDVRRSFPNVYGFFAPTTGEFDYNAYARQFRSGQREGLTPEQAVQLANNRIASHLFAQVTEIVGPNPDEAGRAKLRAIKEALRDEYYGFDLEVRGTGKRIERKDAIAELARAVKNPKIARTDAGQGLKLYLQARQVAVEKGGTPTSFQRNKSMKGTRDALRAIAASVIEEHPDFEGLWQQVFSNELNDDVEDGDG